MLSKTDIVRSDFKVLIITGMYPTRENPAAGIFITRMMQKLQQYGVQYDLISFCKKENWDLKLLKRILNLPLNEEKEIIRYGGVQYNFIPINVSIMDYRKGIDKLMVDAVKKQINLSKYDLLHAHWVYPHGYIATRLKNETGLPCIVTAHGSDIHTNPLKRKRSKSLVISTLHTADKVIFTSNRLYEIAKELGYQNNNRVIMPMGVETNKFFPLAKENVKDKLGLKTLNLKYIGYIGALRRIKGADRLPEIFKQVARRYNSVQFIVIGDGEVGPEIKKKCVRYNLNILFKGTVSPEEMPFWLNVLDALVVPSRNEGFPCIISEAQACGCPVVGSNAGGIPEAVGDGGLIVDDGPNFEEEFSFAVIQMLEKPPPREQIRGQALKFDWDLIIRKHIDLYEDMLRQHH